MTSTVLIPQRVAYDFPDFVIEFGKRRFKTRLIVDAVRGGEDFKAGNPEQIFPCVVGITGQMLSDECLNFYPVRKLARELTRSGEQNELLAERTAQKQDVGMSVGHGLIIAQRATRKECE